MHLALIIIHLLHKPRQLFTPLPPAHVSIARVKSCGHVKHYWTLWKASTTNCDSQKTHTKQEILLICLNMKGERINKTLCVKVLIFLLYWLNIYSHWLIRVLKKPSSTFRKWRVKILSFIGFIYMHNLTYE